ncbi:Phosphoinositide phosphatase sac1, partial [Linderina pennispora]
MVTAQQSFKISFYPSTVTVEATRGADAEHLAIDRASGVVRLEETSASTAFSATPQRTFTAHGILGVINLLRGAYLVVITGREAVGSIGGSTVFRVSETKVIKAASDAYQVSGTAAFDEARYLKLLSEALAAKSFYFSYDYDLTSSLQRQQLEKQRLGGQPGLYETASDEFFYTKFLAQPIIAAVQGRAQGSVFVLPVIHGFFECKPVSIRGTQFNYVLVTRRGRKRQGTRYFSRGADADGNVSNFAETEQIVDFAATSGSPELAGLQLAYVQIRGSIPVAWAQVINMKYVPALKVDVDGSRERFDKHLNNTIAMYGAVVAVNLVNKKKYEKPMGDAFAQLSQEFKSPHYHYTHFDFHKECSKMRYDRLSLLTNELAEYMTRFGSFKAKQGEPETVQQGVVRTNCMDCLDRTNVVQTEFARSVLTKQLRDVGVFGATDAIDAFPAFQSMLRNVWADNADA